MAGDSLISKKSSVIAGIITRFIAISHHFIRAVKSITTPFTITVTTGGGTAEINQIIGLNTR